MKLVQKTVFMAQLVMVTATSQTIRLKKDERGGISPLVVTIGLALVLVGIIIAFSSTLQNAISNAINNVISKLNSL